MELHNTSIGEFCQQIKSQLSDLAINIPICYQFSKKNQQNESIKNKSVLVLLTKSNLRADVDLYCKI